MMMRINLIGTSGSGKTTFGRQLTARLGVPFVEMDALFWGSDWTFLEYEVLFSKLDAALEEKTWVLDGNYTRTLPKKWEQVQVVIWLDYSFPRILFQAITRAFIRILTREELWPGTGNRETIRKLLSSDSILLWTIKSYRKNRNKITEFMTADEFSQIRFIRLKSPREADDFLAHAPDNLELGKMYRANIMD
jgi:adenylate kinase family enzyme